MARPRLDTPNFRLIDRNGTWYIRWWHDGAWHRISTGATDRRDAEAFLSRFQAGTDEPAAPEERTLAEIIDAYLEDRQGRVAAFATLRYAGAALKRHLGNLTVDALTVRRCRLYAEQRRTEGHQVGPAHRRVIKPTADGTIIRELVTLRAAIRWAIEHKWISPTDEPKIEVPSAGPPRDRWLTRDESQRLLLACERPHLKLFVALGLYTAARASAILELTWDQIDFTHDLVLYGQGIGNKRRTPLPIAAPLRPYLVEAHSGATTDFVIEHAGKRVLSIKTGFNAAVNRAGLSDDVTPHILRHTCATWLSMAGRPMSEIARYLGNTEKMVEKVYAKYHPDYLRDAARALS